MTDEQLQAMVERLRAVEDQLSIYQLIATYGPGVDSLSGDVVGDLWADDGVYDAGGIKTYVGRQAVGDLVTEHPHTDWVAGGCAHVMSLPHVSVAGDRAVATGYSRVYRHGPDGWFVERVSANRWELDRTESGWQVRRRDNRPLTGEPGARDLLAEGIAI